MDRSKLNQLKQDQSTAKPMTSTKPGLVVPESAVNVDAQDIKITGISKAGVLANHDRLLNLDYEHSGHTGFAGILYNTTVEWRKATDYIPPLNMIIVYTDYRRKVDEHGQGVWVPTIKLGDGQTLLKDLAFVDEDVRVDLLNHIENNTIHITQSEREFWNNKLNFDMNEDAESLIFTRE